MTSKTFFIEQEKNKICFLKYFFPRIITVLIIILLLICIGVYIDSFKFKIEKKKKRSHNDKEKIPNFPKNFFLL